MRLEERAAAIGAARAAALADRLAETAAALPGVVAERDGDAVRLRGRMLDEPLLRVPGAML